MQKLKDYLSALIEAVFGKKKSFISNQAMLDLNHIIEIEGDSYIAPCDGAVRALINDEYDGRLGSGYISIYGVALKTTLSQVVYPNDASGNKTVWQSVAKGDQVMFSRRNVNEPSWQKHFFRTIGGGHALLKTICGREVCKGLNLSFSRYLSLAVAKQCHLVAELYKKFNQLENGKSLQLRLMGIFQLVPLNPADRLTHLKSQMRQLSCFTECRRLLQPTLEEVSLVEKATSSKFYCQIRQAHQLMWATLSGLSAKRNSFCGGTL